MDKHPYDGIKCSCSDGCGEDASVYCSVCKKPFSRLHFPIHLATHSACRKGVAKWKPEELARDSVSAPGHYTQSVPGIECIDVAKHFNFNRGNAIKYIWRAGVKTPDTAQDLNKAIQYLIFELERIGASMTAKPRKTGP